MVEFALLCCVLDPMWSFSFLCVCLCYHRMCGSVVGAVILRLQGAVGVVTVNEILLSSKIISCFDFSK